MRRLILLLLLLAVVAGCGGGGSLAAPSGAVMTFTPTAKEGASIEITSTSPLQKSTVQLYQLSVRDSSLAGAKGVRDTIFNVTFELTNVPGTTTADLASLVTLCDGSAIINTTAERQTDNQGNYNLCVVYKVGGGLGYSGNLRAFSGSSSATTSIKVMSTLPPLAVLPSDLIIPAGSRGQFTINGGSPEYTVTSSDAAIPSVPLVVTANGGTFIVTVPAGTPKGTILSYIVRDSAAGTPVTAKVTVGDPPPPTVLPASATVVAGGTVKFMIIGGVPDYTIFTDNSSITLDHNTVTASGGTFSATVPADAPDKQTFILTVRDSIGGSAEVKITAQAPTKPVITPSALTITAGNTATFAISLGVPGYTVVTNNAMAQVNPVQVADSGDTFRVLTSTDLKTSFTITAIDSIGQTTTPVTVTVTPVKSSQRISFGTAPGVIVGGTGTVSATASSGLTVTFTSLTTSVCTISGSTVTGVSAGTCIIAGDQPGNTDYNAAPQATLTFNIAKGNQTITFGAAPSVSVGGTGPVFATASSGLPVTFASLTNSVCTISGLTVTGVSAGTCIIAGDQAGGTNYNAAPQATLIFTINP